VKTYVDGGGDSSCDQGDDQVGGEWQRGNGLLEAHQRRADGVDDLSDETSSNGRSGSCANAGKAACTSTDS
jgi:hypothetical protein